uniref:YTH domain-containing family protein n=1 Tax=Rhizophora mucronata TaxID=61149 RepID=A0A2P2K5C3_RHIMU
MYNVLAHGNMEAYVIQGAEINNNLTNSLLEQVEAMYTEATPECFVDQGLYYPTATNYGYYCTGFESPGEWEDHQRVFGIDGPEVQYAGTQTENLPYVYYTPSYGYAQSPYNPYNPYIPGAMMGADGPYVGAQQYYTIPPYQDPVSSPGYIPIVAQSDINPSSLVDSSIETGVAFAGRSDDRNWKHGLPSSSTSFPRNLGKPASNQTNSFPRISEVPRSNAGTGKQSMRNRNISSGFPTPQSRVLESLSASGSIQALDNISSGKVLPHSSQLKVSLPVNGDFADFGPSSHGRTGVDRMRTKFQGARTLNVVNGNLDGLGEQNRGPRTNKLKSQFAVKAYTTTVGNTNSQGNIIICADHYNKDDFLVDYVHAKFFVIKSYSEDDVHKSLKYNVWSSTPHGNKKLQGAYEEAQKIAAGSPRGCPIFLLFSVSFNDNFVILYPFSFSFVRWRN